MDSSPRMSATICSYTAAASLREKADELAAWEEDRWNKERQEELLQKESNFKSKVKQELDAVTNRLAQQRSELARQRQKALEMLLVRYSNSKAEVERQHKMERQKFDKDMAIELKLIRGQTSKLSY
jgi:hypothetical protein